MHFRGVVSALYRGCAGKPSGVVSDGHVPSGTVTSIRAMASGMVSEAPGSEALAPDSMAPSHAREAPPEESLVRKYG